MAKLFGTNGVRGIFGTEFTLDLARDLTYSLATYFEDGPILVGYDGRISSTKIASTIRDALNNVGLDCMDAGLVPTPCLEFAVKKLGYKGGIMITASHNPPEYNGIKPADHDGIELSRKNELIVEENYFTKNWPVHAESGKVEKENRAIDVYIDGILSQIDSELIKKKNFTVVLDLGNGAQAVAAPILCERLNCDIITINGKIDGNFPGRASEPTTENLDELSSSVLENNASLGIAFDGDGDRSVFCDDEGNIVSGDRSALLLSKYILQSNPNSIIVTGINSTNVIDTIAAENNSTVVRTIIGSVVVSRKMAELNAIVGFEENGGFMYGRHNMVRDGSMTLALMLDLLAKDNDSLSIHIGNLLPSFTTKTKIKCSFKDATRIIKLLVEEYPDSDTSDGIKITLGTQEWVMIRPSGTEPILRIYAESTNHTKLNEIIIRFTDKINSLIIS